MTAKQWLKRYRAALSPLPKAERERERKRQEAMLSIKKKFGKNAILEGISFTEGATGRERNETIGGHKA